MKSVAEMIAILEALDMDTYSALYESDEALASVGLTREEFEAYVSYEDFPEGDPPEDWSDPVWDE